MSERPRILIVEDETDLCRILSEQLSREGYEVECAHDAVSALVELSNDPFDLVLTDLMMPGMTGTDLLRMVRQADSDIPVIILTGHESVESAVMATHLRVSDYLTKATTSGRDLVDAVRQALSNPPPS